MMHGARSTRGTLRTDLWLTRCATAVLSIQIPVVQFMEVTIRKMGNS